MASIRERKHPSGRVYFEARVVRKGHPPISKSFKDSSAAEKWATDTEETIAKGGKVTHLPSKLTIEDVLNDYVEHLEEIYGDRKASKRVANAVSMANSLTHHLASYTVETLTRRRIQKFLGALKKSPITKQARKEPGNAHPLYEGDAERKYSPATIRRTFYCLKVAMEWHASENHYSQALEGKFENIVVPGSWSAPRERRLEGDEGAKLLEACKRMRTDPDGWRTIIQLALATGMRAQELTGMVWSEFHPSHKYVGVPKERDKTKRGRDVPLSPTALRLLQEWKPANARPSDRVFPLLPLNSSQFSRGFKRITKGAGIEGLHFHDLRHEAISLMFELTQMDALKIAKITGHTDINTLRRYANLRPNKLADEMVGMG